MSYLEEKIIYVFFILFNFKFYFRKLEWNLRVQNFKISEEKKIVAEIDSLKRSKKNLE